MRKILLLLCIVMFLFACTGVAGAALYEEKFLFGAEGEPFTGWYVGKDKRVEVNFDLTQYGNDTDYVKKFTNQVLDTRTPVVDAAGYVPGTWVNWAKLSVALSSVDDQRDPIRIFTSLLTKDKIIYQNFMDLTNDYTGFETYLPNCVLSQLESTGGLATVLISPYWVNGEIYNEGGYTLHEIALTAKVPEPSTLLLVGAGLCGLLGFGRFRKS